MSTSVIERKRAVSAWTRLVRVYQKVDHASAAVFAAYGLNTAWFDVLARVSARPGMTQGELAAALLVTKGNVSQLVAKLVAGGLLERRAQGRSQHLWLTTHGSHLASQAVPQQENLLATSLEGLSAIEQTELLRLLRKWEKA